MIEQSCGACYFYQHWEGRCKNPESAWEDMQRRGDEGVYCPDYELKDESSDS